MADPQTQTRPRLPSWARDILPPDVPAGVFVPPRQSAQPRLSVPGDAYDASLPAPPAPPSEWDVADAALAPRRAEMTALAKTPYTGGKKAYEGLRRIGMQLPPFNSSAPNPRELAGGTADVIGGGMEAGTLLLPAAMAKHGAVKVAAGLLGGTAAAEATYAAGEQLGIPKEYVDLAAHAVGLAGGLATSKVVESPEARAHILSEAKRFYTDESGALQMPGGKLFTGTPEHLRPAGEPPEFVEEARGPLAPPEAPPMPRALDALGGQSEVAKVAKGLFPRLDNYGKPAGRLNGASILKRLETTPDLAPEVKAALSGLAEQVGDRRIAPDELHALAAGEAYRPERVIRRVNAPAEGTKQRVGAPYGVTNARQERGLRENYMDTMEVGKEGRDWYDDSGQAIMFHANDDPARANLLAGDLSITSPVTNVEVNAGMGVKGYNQANAGVPVRTGRFPTAMSKSIEAAHATGAEATGLKRLPFQQNLARGGRFLQSNDPPRAVHDVWDAEAWGYMNPDGTPMRTGFGPAQHRWMDTQQDKMLATANERAVGGYDDWSELKSQAGAWTGQQIKAGRLDPKDAAKAFDYYFKRLVAQGSRETIPGPTTGHMPEMLGPGMEPFRQHLHNVMMNEAGIYDPQGRDQITAGFGGLSGRAFEGPGLYKGEISPGMQTRVLTGSEEVPGGPTGARQVDEGSRRLMNASEATYALGMGQDAGAWSRLMPAGSGAQRGLWDVALPGGTITKAQLKGLALRFPNIGDMAVISTDDGVRLGNMDPATMQAIVKILGGTVKGAGAGLDTGQGSGYMSNDWRQQRAGQDFLDPIRQIARGPERFNEFAPAMFDRIRRADAMFRRDTGGRFSLSQMRDELLGTVAGEGWQGLERLAKKYALPVTLLVAGLQALGQPVPPGAPEPPESAPQS